MEITRWVDMDISVDWICDNCPIYKTTSGTAYCNDYDKYVDVYNQVSYDDGNTWETTAITPVLVEEKSDFCGYQPTYQSCTWIIEGNMIHYDIILKKYDKNTHVSESIISQGTCKSKVSGVISFPSDCTIKQYPPSSYTFDDSDNYSIVPGIQEYELQFLQLLNNRNGDNLFYYVKVSKLTSSPAAYITFKG